eukprot:CAMPEP_0203668686 /NCGR_PEP_ID=MMETSP0090-20130426/5251_1 /ASSEMBLY_ACC=CAM_ASM_001088 /TAXON_ID=426623 /ORGANISM="Chaetoceros affinis, Strain CCMP159" /LENGTH=350 /DNA_ID=CAMNT_0050533187 /DNA_START=213 /DNA_END=1265 /DNA_ORIENTATION=-
MNNTENNSSIPVYTERSSINITGVAMTMTSGSSGISSGGGSSKTNDSMSNSSESSSSFGRINHLNDTTYLSTKLPMELAFCVIVYIVGVYMPSIVIKPFLMNFRPIPYQQLPNSNDVVLDFALNNPLVEDVTFPSGLLIHTCITIPLILLILVTAVIAPAPQLKPKYHDVHSAVCVLLMTIGMSEFLTQVLKYYVGRLRPNFYALCGFDISTLSCLNSIEMETEGRSSFPSGHSSLSFSAMGVLAYFFLGRVGIAAACNSGNQMEKNTLRKKLHAYFALSPLLYSTFCASSRLVDNWHHPGDVVAGTCLGLFCSTVGYHLFYSPVTSAKHAGTPLSYLNAFNGAKGTVID